MDKTLSIARWFHDNCPEFSTLKAAESRQLTHYVMVLAKIYFIANGLGGLIPHPIAACVQGPSMPYLDERRGELQATKADFSPEELHHLKTLLRRFAYTAPESLKRGLMSAEPFAKYAAEKRPRQISDNDIPADFLKAMHAVYQQFKDDELNYAVIKVNGRNFFAEPGFKLRRGDYDDIARAMSEGLMEQDTAYRLARDKAGNLLAY